MMEIGNGQETILVNLEDNIFQVQLKPNQYVVTSQSVIAEVLNENSLFLSGEIAEENSSELLINYDIPTNAQPLDIAKKNLSYAQKLDLVRRFNVLCDWQDNNINLFIAPQNIFVKDGVIKLAHRGFEKIMTPDTENTELFFLQYKALIVFTLTAKYQFTDLVSGAKGIKSTFEKSIMQATSYQEVDAIIQKKYQKVITNQMPTNRKKYAFYKYSFFAAVAAVLVAVGIIYYNSEVKQPIQNRVIASQSAFIAKKYDKTTEILKDDNPQALSKSAQYTLAVSYINQDALTETQKATILDNISPQSETNILLYWIYIGRGSFKKSLNVAKNLGDDQLTLYSYIKLYDQTKADIDMKGAMKQELLKSYQAYINMYVKKLGGETDAVKK